MKANTAEIFYSLFYIGVLALVAGCIIYLVVTREKQERTPRWRIREAEKLSGTYGLSDLGNLLNRVASLEAWGVVVDLRLRRVRGSMQMIVDRDVVELYQTSLEPEDIESFRKSAEGAGLRIRPAAVEGQYCVDIQGTWPSIADTVQRILRSLHGVGDEEIINVDVFD